MHHVTEFNWRDDNVSFVLKIGMELYNEYTLRYDKTSGHDQETKISKT